MPVLRSALLALAAAASLSGCTALEAVTGPDPLVPEAEIEREVSRNLTMANGLQPLLVSCEALYAAESGTTCMVQDAAGDVLGIGVEITDAKTGAYKIYKMKDYQLETK